MRTELPEAEEEPRGERSRECCALRWRGGELVVAQAVLLLKLVSSSVAHFCSVGCARWLLLPTKPHTTSMATTRQMPTTATSKFLPWRQLRKADTPSFGWTWSVCLTSPLMNKGNEQVISSVLLLGRRPEQELRQVVSSVLLIGRRLDQEPGTRTVNPDKCHTRHEEQLAQKN